MINIISTDLSISLAEKLEFPYEIISNTGHFLASDGYQEFPQLLDWLQMVIGGVERSVIPMIQRKISKVINLIFIILEEHYSLKIYQIKNPPRRGLQLNRV